MLLLPPATLATAEAWVWCETHQSQDQSPARALSSTAHFDRGSKCQQVTFQGPYPTQREQPFCGFMDLKMYHLNMLMLTICGGPSPLAALMCRRCCSGRGLSVEIHVSQQGGAAELTLLGPSVHLTDLTHTTSRETQQLCGTNNLTLILTHNRLKIQRGRTLCPRSQN